MKTGLFVLVWSFILAVADCISLQPFSRDMFPPAKESRYIVLSLAGLGLANRLRSLADWYQIAVISNRTLLVSWKPSQECNVTFSELFQSGPDRFSILQFVLPPLPQAIDMVSRMASENGLTFSNLGNSQNMTFVLPEEQVLSDINVLFSSYDGVITLKNVPCQYYMTKHSEFYRSLVPVPEASEFVTSVLTTYFHDRMMIGIHVRVHDKLFDWSVVPPIGGSKTALTFDEGASLDQFEAIMEGIDQKLSYLSSTGELIRRHRFYLASNSDAVKNRLVQKFPGLVFVTGEYDRRLSDGVYFAFLEWLLLSKSAFIVNTYGSSFAVEAAGVNLTPIIGLWGGHSIQYNDLRLPYCGIMQFVKSYSNQGESANFTEGTFDQRVVKGRIIRLDPCDQLTHFGLDTVYCVQYDD